MKEEAFRREFKKLTPDVPESFHQSVETFLTQKVNQEVYMKATENPAKRFSMISGRRSLVFALVAVLLLGTVAYAATKWGIFDSLGYYLGIQPPTADSVMQSNLHTETVNGVEITIEEAGYDGKTLFLQYSYRFPGIDEPLGTVSKHGELLLRDDDMALFEQYGLGWWVDAFWINGQDMDMANNSGGQERGSANPGEIVRTEYWRLDNIDVALTGKVEIAMPIGESQSAEYRNSLYSKETHQYALPDKGVVTFSFDASDTLSRVVTLNPNVETVLPEVTAKVSEAAFTPLMTYITLDLTANPEALAAFKQENGEGYYDEQGNLLWPYTGMDMYSSWIVGLKLVDGDGKVLFPDAVGNNGVGDSWAEFLYPYMDPANLPEEMWLAPVEAGAADMTRAVRVK